jgi:hypothetical protein
MRERTRFENELVDLGMRPSGKTDREVDLATLDAVNPRIGFEFDLDFGVEETAPPTSSEANIPADYVKLTEHVDESGGVMVDGFKTKMDGNRVEIATMPFKLGPKGAKEMEKVFDNIDTFTALLTSKCGTATVSTVSTPSDTIMKGTELGKPNWFKLGLTTIPDRPFFPLGHSGQPYFRDTCEVKAAAQATIGIPLSSVKELVDRILDTEEKDRKDSVPGLSLTGAKNARAGLRSDAIRWARDKVLKERKRVKKAKPKIKLSDSSLAIDSFSDTVVGLMILMVSYLRSGQMTYGSKDYEGFAKAYLPLNVKSHFRLLFDENLSAKEQMLFKELYGNASVRDKLFALAEPDAAKRKGSNLLFPSVCEADQKDWMNPAPTWDDFVDRTIDKTKPNKRTASGPYMTRWPLGDEMLFVTRSGAVPFEKGIVTLEMRRLGFKWLPSKKFRTLAQRLLKITRKLQK